MNYTHNFRHVIGATAMHSPAASISSASEPPCIPSTDKLVKNLMIAGTTVTIDGEPVTQVAGVSKTLEHVGRRVLRPEVELHEVRNVPACDCAHEEDEEVVLKVIDAAAATAKTDDEGLCYGRKFRPNEGPAYTCGEFGKKGEDEAGCGCGDEVVECEMEEDDCGCEDEVEWCGDEDDELMLEEIDMLEEVLEVMCCFLLYEFGDY